ncbi:MAG: SAM-dependent methyltransferase [Chloroflexota bacterium]
MENDAQVNGRFQADGYYLNTTQPSLTRIFDYLTGGFTNFEVDRIEAKKMLQSFPLLQTWVRLGKAFIQEAVKQLYQEGFVQFLDIGSSIPSEEGIHTFAPAANIIYTDINPIAVSFGNSLYSKIQNVEYIHGDARNVTDIFEAPKTKELVNQSEKLAIGLNFLLLYLSPQENQYLAKSLFEQASYGSKVFQILYPRSVGEFDPEYIKFQEMIQQANMRMNLYKLDEYIEMMHPWVPVRIEPVHQFLGLPEGSLDTTIEDTLGLGYTAAFFEKKNTESE